MTRKATLSHEPESCGCSFGEVEDHGNTSNESKPMAIGICRKHRMLRTFPLSDAEFVREQRRKAKKTE